MFSDYAFYCEIGGKLSEDAYNASVRDAHAEIISQTNGRATNAPEAMAEAVKICECSLVDVIAGYKESGEFLPRGLSSISNDGLSVSAGSSSVNSKSLLQSEAEERKSTCSRYLQYPENLMSRWA